MQQARRVSAVLDGDEVRLACELAEEDGLSLTEWVVRTLRHRLRIAKGLRGVAAYEGEDGRLPPEALRRAVEELDRGGINPSAVRPGTPR